jgi:hypothetical protein
LALLLATTAAAVDYPGAPPCDTTLQACLDGVAAGAVVEIVTETPMQRHERSAGHHRSWLVEIPGRYFRHRVLDR